MKHGHGLLLNEFIEMALDKSLVLRRYLTYLLQHQRGARQDFML